MEIKVFGPGCARCNDVEKLLKEIVTEQGKDYLVEKVSDYKQMMALGIMSTPAVAIDGKVKSSGRIPSREEMKEWLK